MMNQPMIKSVNGWRAIFALIIVLFHVGISGLEELTWAGVAFFFMASGFLLRLKYPFTQFSRGEYSRFAWHHALKLYPLHWLALALLLLAMALVGTLVIKPGVLALDVALLQSWSMQLSVYYSYNPFAWFLSTLLFCYLCYPLLAKWFSPMRLHTKGIILIVLAIIDIVVLGFTDFYGRTALYVFPLVRLIDFMIGMTLADALSGAKQFRVIGKSNNGTDLELIAIAALSVMVMTYRAYPFITPWCDAVIWWLPVMIILLTCWLYNGREGFIGKLLVSRPLQWLGGISFELFILQSLGPIIYNYLVEPVLWHFGIIDFANMVSNDLCGSDIYLLHVFILPIDILIAWLVNRLFTRPLHRLLASNGN